MFFGYEFIIYLCVGALAGFMSGLIGISGGLVIVPSLLFIFKHLSSIPNALAMQYAAGTSLTATIFTGMASMLAHRRRGHVDWSLWRLLVLAVLAGVIIGVLVARELSTSALTNIFGVVMLILAIQMAVVSRPQILQFQNSSILLGWGVVTGALAGMLGIGGGVLLVPLLIYYHLPTRKAMGTSAALVMPIAFLGSLLFMFLGQSGQIIHVQYSLGLVYWPAFVGVVIGCMTFPYLGVMVNSWVPKFWLKKIFAVVLLIVAIRLLID